MQDETRQDSSAPQTRAIELDVFIDAPVDAVWRALSQAEELTRWFPVDARVEPGVGGTFWISWGEGAEGGAPITLWEPQRALGWTETYGAIKLAVEFHIEAQGSGTIVRLVNSGFDASSDWDEQFHMTEGGWTWFLAHLRHYLEKHRGVARDLVSFRQMFARDKADAYARLTGPAGLAAEGSLAGLQAGDAFRVTTAAGDVLEGTVIVARPPMQLGLRLTNLSESLLFLEMESAQDGVRPGFWLSTYGMSASALSELRTRFGAVYQGAME